jgi:dGTPase
MKDFGGFSHNSHALKIITKLETRFIEFEGLNLSWEVLEGVVKHNGPIANYSNSNSIGYIQEYNQKHDLDLKKFSSLEAQISSISDDIAYNNHDIEDGLRADLFKIEQLFELPLVGEIYQEILQQYPKIKRELLVGEAKKRLTLAMVLDVIKNTEKNLSKNKIKTIQEVRNFQKPLVGFSKSMENSHQILKKFLMQNMYRHPMVNKMTKNAKKIIGVLFDSYLKNPQILPKERAEFAQNISNKKNLAILIADYIAGMTDRFAIKEFDELKKNQFLIN